MEDKEEPIFMEMEEVEMSYREIWNIIDKTEVALHQLMMREEEISDWRCPLNLNHPDFLIGVVWDLHPQEHPPHSAPDVQAEQIDNVQNQLNVSTAGEIRTERVETSNSERVNISPQTEQPREDQDISAIVRPAPLNIEVGTQRNDIESNEENANNVPPSQTRSVRPSLQADDVLLIGDVP